MNEFVFEAEDESATERFGVALANVLQPGATVALCGTLGAGKTRLVQAIAAASGIPREQVVSPTFVLVQQYYGNREINHLDAYRVRDDEEFRALGVEELLASDAITIIEWADRVERVLPDDYLQIEIAVTGQTTRRFVVKAIGLLPDKLIDALAAELSA
jgi:tRNA threonylcarbamoyladenosine biosynthesis protein TsaE